MSDSPIWKDLPTLRQWIAACELDGAPTPEQYVDFDQWPDPHEEEKRGLRGQPVRNQILAKIRLRPAHVNNASILFAGFRGSGKTTELTRLEKDLKAEAYRVIRADVSNFDTFTSAQSIEELTIVLAAAIGSASGSPELLGGSVFDRLRDFLKSLKPTGAEIDFSAFNLQFAIRDNASFRQRVRQAFATRPEELRTWFHTLISELVAADSQHRPLVIIVDGLEKYRVDYEYIAQTYHAVAKLYAEHADWLKLPGCNVVYCVPPVLAIMARNLQDLYQVVPTMTCVRTHRSPPGREKCEPGYEALRTAMGKRADLRRLFGDQWQACADEIVTESGGHIRRIVTLLAKAIEQTFTLERYLSPEDLRKLFAADDGISFENVVTLLKHVSDGGDLTKLTDEDFGALAIALDQHLVLAYENGKRWYDVAPEGERSIGRCL